MAKKTRDPNTAPGEDSLHGDSADDADSRRKTIDAAPDNAETAAEDGPVEPDWLGIARDSYEDSTEYVESSLRVQWERNERAFQSRHQSGSKYLSDQYKGKSRLFRPKTRTNIRQAEAALAQSMFSNENVLSVEASDDNDPEQLASAEINKEIMQYRLTQPSPKIGIPWFVTCIGAVQNAQKYGTVVSKQWWEYRTRKETTIEPDIDQETGQQYIDEEGRPAFVEVEKEIVITDKPHIDLFEVENVRIDRGADWTDPINSSPFVILLHPMYIHEVESRMNNADAKTGQEPWKKVARSALAAASNRHNWDSTRTQREGNREDPKESEISIAEFQIVWVHENFVTWDDREWVYYTAGVHHMLSDPVPLEKAYPHCDDGVRPITMGCIIVEAHKNYPSGKPQLTEGLQAEANELVNLRLDNVKLALNKRYIVKRGKQVDLRSLLRNVSGSVTLANDPEEDVKVLETRDVTGSSYKEQDRINADFDDIAGGFSAGTVQTNRAMNETVGGMELLAGGGNMLQELDLRTFIETWAEPTISQVLKMIQIHETDETIIALAGKKAQIYQRYGISTITDDLLRKKLTCRINVGIGATDPDRKLNRFLTGAKAVGELLGPSIMTKIKVEEVVKEIFGALGYRDGKRFFKFDGQDPMVEMLQQQMQELQKSLDRKELDAETKVKVAETLAMAKIMTTQMEGQTELEKTRMREKGMQTVEEMRAIAAAQIAASKTSQDRNLARINNMADFEKELMKVMAAAKQQREAKPNG